MILGRPRSFMQRFQDAIGIIAHYGRPDLFITMTCNPMWPEIQNELKECKNSYKLTIIARVFNLKQAIKDEIYKIQIFGKVPTNLMVIEFQKCGLPHAHIIVILDEHSKPRNSDDFDQILCAEIPDKKSTLLYMKLSLNA